MADNKKFIYYESTQIPLKEVPYGDLKANLIDPTTGKPYKGIVLEGPAACLKPKPNNNKRVYDVDEYLKLLEKLKIQIHSKKGVYGELEHPEKYSVNFNNVSHKILDVWYKPEEMMVCCRIILLNTPKGKIAQEIVRSGGQLALSARAAGDEIAQSDGTYKAVTKILTTYDLVYHPGFSEAVLEFKELNESQKRMQTISQNKTGFGFMLYQNQLSKIPSIYNQYIKLNEATDEEIFDRRSKCFLEYLFENLNQDDLSEQDEEEKHEQEVMEENEPSNQKAKQQKLKNAAQKDLKQKQVQKLNQDLFFQEASIAQSKLRKRNKQSRTYFDNSAGFVTEGISTNIE